MHRDVTPQNVLISQQGEVKLADFGIAKAIGKSEKSATGVIKGKFAYMSPEQSQARPLDARSDLFSVGTMLYLLTTGKKPFDGPTDTDVIMQVRRARPEKPSTLVRDLNADVERLIARALRADPDKRWQSAEQMAERIDAILVKLGQPSGPAPLKRWLEALSARDGAKPPPVADPRRCDPSIAVDLGSIDLELEEVEKVGDNDRRRRGSGHRPRDASAQGPPSPERRPARDLCRAAARPARGGAPPAPPRARPLQALGAADDHPRRHRSWRSGARSTSPGRTCRPGQSGRSTAGSIASPRRSNRGTPPDDSLGGNGSRSRLTSVTRPTPFGREFAAIR